MPNPFDKAVTTQRSEDPGRTPATSEDRGGDVTSETRVSRDPGERRTDTHHGLDIPPERPPPPAKAPPPDPSQGRLDKIESQLTSVGQYLTRLHGFLEKKFSQVAPPAKTEEDPPDEGDPETRTIVEKMFQEKMGPLVEEYRRDRNQDGRKETAATHQDWAKYESAIDEVAKLVPDEVLAKPGAWEFLYRYVKVQNYDTLVEEIREQVRQEMNDDPSRPPGDVSLRPGAPPLPDTNGKSKLTAKEREIADKMGIPHDEYGEYKAEQTARSRA
jgi:hypothetical protein